VHLVQGHEEDCPFSPFQMSKLVPPLVMQYIFRVN
jgi:hypothetical protein